MSPLRHHLNFPYNGLTQLEFIQIHEVYLHPFLKAVQAGVTSIMCSYNQVNETYSCENDHVLNDLLKTELGFQGCESSLVSQ